jgi:hypothetical protein
MDAIIGVGVVPEKTWKAMDIAFLERCDAVIALPDWRTSSGSRDELFWCDQIKKPWAEIADGYADVDLVLLLDSFNFRELSL